MKNVKNTWESVKKEQTELDIPIPDIKLCYKSTVIRQNVFGTRDKLLCRERKNIPYTYRHLIWNKGDIVQQQEIMIFSEWCWVNVYEKKKTEI